MKTAYKLAIAAATIAVAAYLLNAWNDGTRWDNEARDGCTKMITPRHPTERAPTPRERSDFISECTKDVSTAYRPCREEYKYGTDSAIQCEHRYGDPVWDQYIDVAIQIMTSPLPGTNSQEPEQKPGTVGTDVRQQKPPPSPPLAQGPSGNPPSTRPSAIDSRDTTSPFAAITESVTKAAERVVQILSTVPINYPACSSAARDAEQVADKAIRQLKALPEGQVGQAQRESLERAFGTFARAMHLVSDGAAQRRPRTRAATA